MSEDICPVCLHTKEHIAHTYQCHQITMLRLKNKELRRKLDNIEEILHKMDNWCNAYPIDIFPEPDLKLAKQILYGIDGVSLDSISAHAMRHVVNGMKGYVQEALKKLEEK